MDTPSETVHFHLRAISRRPDTSTYEDVTLEVCVTSNVQTCAVPDIASHPVRRFFDEGIKVTYNTDDMTVSGITLQSEAQLLSDKFGFTADELAQMQQNAAMASFAPERMIKKT